MFKSIDAGTMRQLNKRSVFRLIRDIAPVSRVKIAEKLDLNKATVSSLVDELLAEQYVLETGYGQSRGGRKPVLLELNPEAAYSIGIDLQITHSIAVLSDLRGNIVAKYVTPMQLTTGETAKSQLLEYCQHTVERFRKLVVNSPNGIIGVGIAVPGMVDYQSGHIHYLPNLEITNWNLRADLERTVQIPVIMDNDANCGAWSSFMSVQDPNLVFINAGIGVGTGIMSGGELFRGANGTAGEFGHMTITALGMRCSCGNYGCWEMYASLRALLRILGEQGVPQSDLHLEAEFVEQCLLKAKQGISPYQYALQQIGTYLGIGIANVVNGLNPSRVYISGSLMQAADILIPEVKRAISYRTVLANRQLEVCVGSEDSVVTGAAILVLSSLLFQQDVMSTP